MIVQFRDGCQSRLSILGVNQPSGQGARRDESGNKFTYKGRALSTVLRLKSAGEDL